MALKKQASLNKSVIPPLPLLPGSTSRLQLIPSRVLRMAMDALGLCVIANYIESVPRAYLRLYFTGLTY
jgi:hypothetical protein